MANENLEKAPKLPKKKDNGFAVVGKRISRWFREMRSELKKVVWPTRKQTINNSVVAGIVIIAASVMIYGFDQVAMLVVNTLINLGS